MKVKTLCLTIFALCCFAAAVRAQNTSFTYQGRLTDNGGPSSGVYDLQFVLWTALVGGDSAYVEEKLATPVTNGLFTVTLNPAVTLFDDNPLWIEVSVRSAGEANYETLSPRQRLTAAPYANHSQSALRLSGEITASNIPDGTITPAKLASSIAGVGLSFNNNALEIAFSGNGLSPAAARSDHNHFGQVWGGSSDTVAGLSLENSAGYGLSAQSTSLSGDVAGIFAESLSSTGYGVSARAPNGQGIGLLGSGGGRGVQGNSEQGIGVAGYTVNGTGVYGDNGNSDSVGHAGYFNGRVRVTKNLVADTGVYGSSGSGFAISGTTTDGGTGVYGSNGNNSTNGHAGYFNGRVRVTKNLSVDGGLYSELSEGWAVAGVTTGTGSGIYGSNGNSDTTGYAGFFNGRTVFTRLVNAEGGIGTGGQQILRFVPDYGPNGAPTIIGGSSENFVVPGVRGATIAGGGGTNEFSILTGQYASHVHYLGSDYATIGGGLANSISGGNYSMGEVIAGGSLNVISSDCLQSTISGGFRNTVGYGSAYCTIAGGAQNHIQSASDYSIIAAGYSNQVYADYCFAAGYRAKAFHDGSFVWADTHLSEFSSSKANEFAVRAGGGVRLYTRTNHDALTVESASPIGTWVTLANTSAGGKRWSVISSGEGNGEGAGKLLFNDTTATRMQLDSGGLRVNGTFVSASDRDKKENFAEVSSREVLDKLALLPIQQWNYKDDKTTRHIGPMAQDFYTAFKVGSDERHIAMVDADGVALTAIKGLHEVVKEKDAKISALEDRLRLVEERLASILSK